MPLTASDFDYPLELERIAQRPLPRRDQSRLMILRRADGGVSHRIFGELPDLLRPGDLLVLNDTRVVPARFVCRRATGGRIDGLFLREQSPGRWEVMLKGAGRCRTGETLAMSGPRPLSLTLADGLGEGRWMVDIRPPAPAVEVLSEFGHTPLPPYIRRPAAASPPEQSEDLARYQTVYAARPGAVAAPTAGLHFTDELRRRLGEVGIETACVTLHVGLGTFAPVKVEDLSAHRMHREWYDLPPAAARAVNDARAAGRRVVAVGTTSLRVLETVADEAGRLRPASGWTDLFLYPPAEFRAVDALITNFHLPRSTLLMLVAAFCSPGSTAGVGTILAAYAEAIRAGYRFYSYGDAMLIE